MKIIKAILNSEFVAMMAGLVIGLTIVFSFTYGGLCGNQYFKTNELINTLHAKFPDIVSVKRIERNIFFHSRAIVLLKDGTVKTYCIDSNILFSYDLFDCEHPVNRDYIQISF